MKAIVATGLLILAALGMHFALGASRLDRPPGVEESEWLAVSDKMGFVVTTPHTYPPPVLDKQPLMLTPPAEGYFMVRTGIGWQRLTIKDPLKGPGASG
jgi:hypothetical protein